MVKKEKAEEVKRILALIERYPTIGLLDLSKIPSKQLQEIKRSLGKNALIKVTKKSLLRLAIESSKKENIREIEKFIPLQPALIFTELDVFRFCLLAARTKSLAFAKEGDITQKAIEIKAGPTQLSPGPVISELTKAGIPVGVESGKIVVKKDVTVAKAGSRISKELASALKKLGIATKEIGLSIVAFYRDGKIYGKDVLDMVGESSLNLLKEAFGQALSLSIAINYPTKENIAYLLSKAWRQAEFIKNKIGG